MRARVRECVRVLARERLLEYVGWGEGEGKREEGGRRADLGYRELPRGRRTLTSLLQPGYRIQALCDTLERG